MCKCGYQMGRRCNCRKKSVQHEQYASRQLTRDNQSYVQSEKDFFKDKDHRRDELVMGRQRGDFYHDRFFEREYNYGKKQCHCNRYRCRGKYSRQYICHCRPL